MARSSKMSVLKRQRERKKAEKAALKREQRAKREPGEEAGGSDQVATPEDLEGYGLVVDPDEDDAKSDR
jgi:hypothetical protein